MQGPNITPKMRITHTYSHISDLSVPKVGKYLKKTYRISKKYHAGGIINRKVNRVTNISMAKDPRTNHPRTNHFQTNKPKTNDLQIKYQKRNQ